MFVDCSVACRACGANWQARFQGTGLPTRIICPTCKHQDAVSIDSDNRQVLYLNPLSPGGRLPQRTAEALSVPEPKKKAPEPKSLVVVVGNGFKPDAYDLQGLADQGYLPRQSLIQAQSGFWSTLAEVKTKAKAMLANVLSQVEQLDTQVVNQGGREFAVVVVTIKKKKPWWKFW